MGIALWVAAWVMLGSAPAAAVTFTKIADASTPGTGWTTAVVFQAPALDAGQVAFEALDAGAGVYGVYTGSGGAVTTIADHTTPVPGGSGTFLAVRGASISQGTVAFVAAAPSGSVIYTAPASGGSFSVVASNTSPDPDGSGTLQPLDVARPAIDGANVAFQAADENGREGYYVSVAGVLETGADAESLGVDELFLTQHELALDGAELAFQATSSSGWGVYAVDAGTGVLRVVADQSVPVPGGSGNFETFDNVVSIDDGNVVFEGFYLGGSGFFAEIGGVLLEISAGEPLLGGASIDGEAVAYVGGDASGQAIWRVRNGVRERLIGTGDLLDGKIVSDLYLGTQGLSGDQLAFTAFFTDATDAVYLLAIPEPGTGSLFAAGLAALAARRRSRRPAPAPAS